MRLTYDNTNQVCDWDFSDTSEELETSIYVSLFTDRVAESTWTKTARGGWFGGEVGSRLWELNYISDSTQYAPLAKSFVMEALQWLLDDDIAQSVDVTTAFSGGRLTIDIDIMKDNTTTQYQYFWSNM